jgi:predicted ArsR family transcriptional regulator
MDAWQAVGVLADRRRRGIYELVRAADRPLSRDEVAARAGVGRPLAAFHLDKLADAGLVEVSYAREPGRGGRGAGRPAKRYADARRQVALTVPERHYELLGHILARAIDNAGPEESARCAAERVAGEVGAEVGAKHRRTRRAATTVLDVAELLSGFGYEPETVTAHEVALRNCPFHAVVSSARDLVCHVNHAFVTGVTAGLGVPPAVSVDLDPQADGCCVRLRSTHV